MSTPKGTKPWNAGTSQGWIDSNGYRVIYVDEGGKRVQRKEHRVVMERELGRKLEPEEAVHHLNGDKSDNRPENLLVVGHGAHTEHHHYGRANTEASKESMATIARQRWEIERLRSINADLLAALELAERTLTSPGMAHTPPLPAEWEVLRPVRAAIAKARGEPDA